ncbi:RHS repeat-associated core domain-containing protein [Streptomyces sp. NPDC086023]|uniref:RHS repeat-associated core domain-containing protein n=1 Tax=Streptomyces sp. NPDC086023 TaxID=3365746 RepID=UPI0037D15117
MPRGAPAPERRRSKRAGAVVLALVLPALLLQAAPALAAEDLAPHRPRAPRSVPVTTPGAVSKAAGAARSTNVSKHVGADRTVKLRTEGLTAVAASAAATGGDAPSGSFAVTSLAPSATWSAGGSAGDFGWSYPMAVPPVDGGLVPKVALGYSSQSVDGRTAATNNQPSWAGQGWDLAPGAIERRYKSCADDLGGNNGQTRTQDLCWGTDNATLSMDGASGELIPVDAQGTTWRLKNDNGMRVQRVTGTANGDDDGESWTVTAQDGTRYHFGSRAASKSVYGVPVHGNHDGEPCHKAAYADSSCDQAYKWHLDQVVDRHGNTMTYTYAPETNHYARGGNTASGTSYTRGGQLERIDYGTREGEPGPAPARVVFETAERTSAPGVLPDTPVNLACGPGACTQTGPSFWTRKRLARVVTQTWNGSAYADVDSWTLRHSFPSNGDGTPASLWLDGITRTGHVGGTLAMPEVVFDGVQMPNRVDEAEGPPMNWWRVRSIRNEFGGTTTVTYSGRDCAPGALPASPESNTRRCLPTVYEKDGKPKLEYFHKYVVTGVVQNANLPGDLSTPVETAYEYVGAPAWAYAGEDGLVPASQKTWSQWRGYGKVRTIGGNAAEGARSLAETTYFRGMDGDKLPAGTRSVTVTDSEGTAVPDAAALAGAVRETVTYDGVGGQEVTGTVNDHWVSAPTATRVRPWGTDEARLTGVAKTRSRIRDAAGAVVRRTGTQTVYDPVHGSTTESLDQGDLATTADDRCTRTEYARNTAAWLVGLPSRVVTMAGDCTAAPAPADVLSDTRTYYDGSGTLGAAPTRGDATRSETLSGWDGAVAQYVTTARTAYDALGRPTSVTDALGRTTATAYLTGPTRVKVTNPLGHAVVAEKDVRGAATAETDANGKRTEAETDPLGRVRKVWLPGRTKGTDGPNSEYQYALNSGKASVVTTLTLGPDGGYRTSYALLDGLGRSRQTQAPTPAGGRTIADTVYDSRGQAVKSNAAYYNSAPAGSELVVAADTAVPSQTRTAYDGAGRVTSTALYSSGVKKWATLTAHDGSEVRVTPPAGGTATATVRDARGQITELRQYQAATPTGAADTTRYGYDRAGRPTTVTTPAGRVFGTEYDVRGLKVRTTDPDRGATGFTYDDAGQLVSTVDAEGRKLFHGYDDAGRRTSLREASATGTLRASWEYDTLARGRLTSATRHVGGAAYVLRTTGYDDGYRPTGMSVTVPPAEGALAGTYAVTMTYTPTGELASSQQPAVGGLPAEKLVHTYDGFGNPVKLEARDGDGAVRTTYVRNTLYTPLGQTAQVSLGALGKSVWLSSEYDQATGRLTRAVTDREVTGKTQGDARYGYDPSGNVTSVSDQPGSTTGVPADHQCFRADHLARLTEAWTPASAACGTPTAPPAGDPVKYWDSYAYDKAGNRTARTLRLGSGTTTSAYAHPAAGEPQPDLVTSVTTTSPGGTAHTSAYTYDATGNTLSRPGQQLAWDPEGRLAEVTTDEDVTEYVYDADGTRLLRKDSTGATLYVGGTELRLSGTSVTGTRYYGLGSRIVAMRTGSGAPVWLSADHHGTATLAFASDTLAVTRRRTLPFGEERGPQVTWPDDHGFLGKTRDASTGLTHLDAREYDTALGRFISVDPVLNPADPQQLNGYAYGSNNPVTLSDPSGRIPLDPDTGRPVNATQPKGQERMDYSRDYMKPRPASAPAPAPKPGAVLPAPRPAPPKLKPVCVFGMCKSLPTLPDPRDLRLRDDNGDITGMYGFCPFNGSFNSPFGGRSGSACVGVDRHGLAVLGRRTKNEPTRGFSAYASGFKWIVSDGDVDDQRNDANGVSGMTNVLKGRTPVPLAVEGQYSVGTTRDGREFHTVEGGLGVGVKTPGASVTTGTTSTSVWRPNWLLFPWT